MTRTFASMILYQSKLLVQKANQLARTRLSGNQWPWCIQLLNGSTSEANRVHENQGGKPAQLIRVQPSSNKTASCQYRV